MANPTMKLNGRDISYYNLTYMEGTIAARLKPSPYKKLVTNESSFIHGTRAITTPSSRRKDKQDLSLTFFLQAASMSELRTKLQTLEQTLINGESANSSYTGVNTITLADYGICLRLVFLQISKVTPWFPNGRAVIQVKFTEPNPNNRSVPS